MNENKRSFFIKVVQGIFKVITFPIYIVFYYIKKLSQKTKFSIRLSLSLMYLKIIIRTLILTGVLTLFSYSTYKAYILLESYNFFVRQIIEVDKMEYTLLRDITNNKHYVIVYDENKEFLFSTNPNHPIDLSNSASRNAVNRNSVNASNIDIRNYISTDIFHIGKVDNNYFLITGKSFLNNDRNYFFNVYTYISDEINDVFNLLKIILLVNIGGIIFALILSIITGNKVFLPISELTEAAKNISDKNMNIRLNISSSKYELKDLARTFNEMMDRIEDGYNRQKQFVSDASHELRTPIAVLQGYTDMLNRWGKNDKEILQESIDAIKNETENMKDLLEKLLFLARNDRGTLILQKETFSLTALLEETIKETNIIDKQHELYSNIEKGVNIYADKNRIKQAIRIFLDNAIKYTPKGGRITVNLIAENDMDKKRTSRNTIIEIIDTGIGMAEEEMKHIFDRFYRSDKSRKREQGGHGLGLSIAKIIILSHEGKINIKSKPSVGTNIKITFPQVR